MSQNRETVARASRPCIDDGQHANVTFQHFRLAQNKKSQKQSAQRLTAIDLGCGNVWESNPARTFTAPQTALKAAVPTRDTTIPGTVRRDV